MGDGYRFEIRPGAYLPMASEVVDAHRVLERLAIAGVDVIVANSEPLSVTGWPTDEVRDAARVLNEAKASAQREHTGRLYGLATLPMQDTAAALEELTYAINELGLVGVGIGSNVGGAPITSPELLPVYRAIEQLDVPLFLHPAMASIANEQLSDYGLDFVIGYMLDTTVAALNLVFSGTLDECPKLKVVHPHLGAVLPYVGGRVDFEYKTPWAGNEELPSPPTAYLRRFFTDTVSDNPAALRMAADFYGIERLMFGSDYPWWTPEMGMDMIRATLGAEEQAAVLGKNARRLLKLGES